jgi:hypothetical protein
MGLFIKKYKTECLVVANSYMVKPIEFDKFAKGGQ